jgi:hypothetical protein
MTANEFRRLALSLPQATESSHMGHPDFRVADKIFATVKPVKGGSGRRGSTTVRLQGAKKAAVREALITAWRNRAPKRLATASEL